jgi:hypothetical protein
VLQEVIPAETDLLPMLTVLVSVLGELVSKSSEYVVDDEDELLLLHLATTGINAASAMVLRAELRCIILPLCLVTPPHSADVIVDNSGDDAGRRPPRAKLIEVLFSRFSLHAFFRQRAISAYEASAFVSSVPS